MGVAAARFHHHKPGPRGKGVFLSGSALVATMLDAYARGYFPMGDPDDPGALAWYNPDPRGVLPLEGFHVPRTVA
ncbi:MAG: hypothetical protein KDA28_16860, partial [Phycisphaerales bacterium]|nr:hypothetical protein [Phycisphaerales bacterium]